MTTNKTSKFTCNALKNLYAGMSAEQRKALAAAEKKVTRVPLRVVMQARLVDSSFEPASEKRYEYPDNTVKVFPIPEHFLLKFDVVYEGYHWEFSRKQYLDEKSLEGFHKAIDKVVELTTKELSRYWDLEKQLEWIADNDFPVYIDLYKGSEIMRFGEPYEPKELQEEEK